MSLNNLIEYKGIYPFGTYAWSLVIKLLEALIVPNTQVLTLIETVSQTEIATSWGKEVALVH
jgi:hypothetical protein